MRENTVATRHWYAIAWTYGRACNEHGDRIGQYYAFARKRDRDAWVGAGPAFVNEAGSREVIPANDRELRRIMRSDAGFHGMRGSIWPVCPWDGSE